MKNHGHTAKIITITLTTALLGGVGFAFLSNPQATATVDHALRQFNENRHVCRVTDKHSEDGFIFDPTYYLHLDCGVDGSEDHKIYVTDFDDEPADAATIYARAHVGEVYIARISYHKGYGEAVTTISPTDLPLGYHFND